MRQDPTSTLVLATVMLLPLAQGLPPTLDDAGSGRDAGGAPGDAMVLDPGSYHANLTPGDADWFAFAGQDQPLCLNASVLAAHAMRVSLAVGPAVSVSAPLDADGLFATTLAVLPADVRLGALPDDAPWDTVSIGPYSFTVSIAPPSAVADTQKGDAGSAPSTASPVPAACSSGVFRADGPDVDTYSFEAAAGSVWTYSLAAPAGSLRVLDPTGAPLTPALPAGGAGSVSVEHAGTYYLQATGPEDDETMPYALGLAAGPDPGNGCRPMCVESDVETIGETVGPGD